MTDTNINRPNVEALRTRIKSIELRAEEDRKKADQTNIRLFQKLDEITAQGAQTAAKLDALSTQVKQEIRQTQTVQDSHHRALYGNGQAGALTRVDRLEQVEVTRKWVIRMLVTAAVSGFIGLVAWAARSILSM